MALHWFAADETGCAKRLLDGGAYRTGTPVFPTAEQPGRARIIEVIEETIRRKVFFKGTHPTEVFVSDYIDIDTWDNEGKYYRPSAPWGLPGPTGPKGNRTFCFAFVSASDSPVSSHTEGAGVGQELTVRRGPAILSSGLGSYIWEAIDRDPTVAFSAGLPAPIGGLTFGGSYQANSEDRIHGTFIAAVDPDISVSLLTPGEGLEDYLQGYLSAIGPMLGDVVDVDVDATLASIVTDGDRILAQNANMTIGPSEFHLDAGDWQDIVIGIAGPFGVAFPAALRFSGPAPDQYFVTDLVMIATSHFSAPISPPIASAIPILDPYGRRTYRGHGDLADPFGLRGGLVSPPPDPYRYYGYKFETYGDPEQSGAT
jgi:hypothetical protein